MKLSKGPESQKLRQQLLEEIRKILRKRKLSLIQAARITGVSETHFSGLVSGKKYYAPPYLLEVFVILGGVWKMDLIFELTEPESLESGHRENQAEPDERAIDMLILTRRVGETVMIGDQVTVTILGVKGSQVRVGINAPKNVAAVHREEIYERIRRGQEDGDKDRSEKPPEEGAGLGSPGAQPEG